MSLPSPLYIACFPLQEVIHDKDTGFLLAGGVVQFWADQAYTIPKNVYKQTYVPATDTYTYTNLGSVLSLNSIGSFEDNDGNQIIPFLFPYEGTEEDPGDVELYFIQVFSSGGVLQFTRDGWPPNVQGSSDVGSVFAIGANQIANPQFVEVLFTENATTTVNTFNVSGSDTESVIAPNWSLITSGTGTVTVSQTNLSETDILSNPPFAINIDSTGITAIKLRQRLTKSPRLFQGQFVNSNFMARGINPDFSIACSMQYVPSSGSSYTLIDSALTSPSGEFTQFNQTVALDGAENSDSGETGFVDIEIVFEPVKNIEITSVQLVEVQSESSITEYLEESTDRQIDHLFHYYKPELEYKPIPNYLLGWDFSFNPCQEYGRTVTAKTLSSANKSIYIADQTIAFQAVDNTLSYTFTDASGITIATSSDTQFALIQYLDSADAIKSLQAGKFAMQIKGNVSADTLTGYLNIYWTDDANLPDITSPAYNSLVSGLSAGVPAVGNGNWNKVERAKLGDAQFIFNTESTVFNFSGWNSQGTAGIDSATFIAIVVSFDTLDSANTCTLKYCTLASGDIATSPPPLTKDQTLELLRGYYETNYNTPLQFAGTASNVNVYINQMTVANNLTFTALYAKTFGIEYTYKRATPVITFYSEAGTADNVTGFVYRAFNNFTGGSNIPISNWSALNIGRNALSASPANNSPLLNNTSGTVTSVSEAFISYFFIADARLGVV